MSSLCAYGSSLPKNRAFVKGKQVYNSHFNTQVFYNVARPDFGAKWQWRFQLQFLFPK